MRATEIIRDLLDLIDQIECHQDSTSIDSTDSEFAAIFTQLSAEKSSYDNTPDPVIQSVHSVTTDAGLGGTNGPKNPADIRSDSVSMFPAFQAEKK